MLISHLKQLTIMSLTVAVLGLLILERYSFCEYMIKRTLQFGLLNQQQTPTDDFLDVPDYTACFILNSLSSRFYIQRPRAGQPGIHDCSLWLKEGSTGNTVERKLQELKSPQLCWSMMSTECFVSLCRRKHQL